MGGNNSKQPDTSAPIETTSPTNSVPCSGNLPSNEKQELQDHPDVERYQKVFKTYYARLCDALPVEEVLPQLVSSEVITIREMDDVLAERTTFRQARALLNGPIWRSISGGYPEVFITLLCVLRHIRSCEALCEEICTKFNISAEVMTSESCELYKMLSYVIICV